LADSANLNFTYNYDSANRLNSRSAPNGVTSSYAYDGRDRLTSLMHTAGATILSGNIYTYNEANDISELDNADSAACLHLRRCGSVNWRQQLRTPTGEFSYDAVGNRTASHLSATYSYQPFNKLTRRQRDL